MDAYESMKLLGSGSFGSAYLVKRKANGKCYVMKKINLGGMQKDEQLEAANEVVVLKQLNHPNIVQYRESFVDSKSLCIVMDYADGGDLHNRIKKQNGVYLSETKILDWFVQICLAVKHMHDKNILHRDLKSQNVFLTSKDQIKLGDFGISRVLKYTAECARSVVGTPFYLSPEICNGVAYNNKSDIWSLGCLLYELTTLRHAFAADNIRILLAKIIRGVYPPIPQFYSQDMASLINSMLTKDSKARPSINAVLRTPILQDRIKFLLSESVLKSKEQERDGMTNANRPSSALKPKLPDITNSPRVLPPMIQKPPSPAPQRASPSVLFRALPPRSTEMKAVDRVPSVIGSSPILPKCPSPSHSPYAPRNIPLPVRKEDSTAVEVNVRTDLPSPRNAIGFQPSSYLTPPSPLRRPVSREYVCPAAGANRTTDMLANNPRSVDIFEPQNGLAAERKKLSELENKYAVQKRAFTDAKVNAVETRGADDVKQVPMKPIVLERRVSPSLPTPLDKKSAAIVMPVAAPTLASQPVMKTSLTVYNKVDSADVSDSDSESPSNSDDDSEKDSANDVVLRDKHGRDDLKRTIVNLTAVTCANLDCEDTNNDNTNRESDQFNVLKQAPEKFIINGSTLNLPGVSSSDSLTYRIESLYQFLSENLGDDAFMKAYHCLKNMSQEDDEKMLAGKIVDIVGTSKMSYLSLLFQLLCCEDSAYCV